MYNQCCDSDVILGTFKYNILIFIICFTLRYNQSVRATEQSSCGKQMRIAWKMAENDEHYGLPEWFFRSVNKIAQERKRKWPCVEDHTLDNVRLGTKRGNNNWRQTASFQLWSGGFPQSPRPAQVQPGRLVSTDHREMSEKRECDIRSSRLIKRFH